MMILNPVTNYIWKNATLQNVGTFILVNYAIASLGGVLTLGKYALQSTYLLGRAVYLPVQYLLTPAHCPQISNVEMLTQAELADRLAKGTLKAGIAYQIRDEGKT